MVLPIGGSFESSLSRVKHCGIKCKLRREGAEHVGSLLFKSLHRFDDKRSFSVVTSGEAID